MHSQSLVIAGVFGENNIIKKIVCMLLLPLDIVYSNCKVKMYMNISKQILNANL